MTRRGLALARRLAVSVALAALVLSLSGDRTSAAGVPAVIYGQDPLEVLELKVRPNVIIVLDSSSSMLDTQDLRTDVLSGDHPRSKLYQGKKVIRDLVAANQNNVSFQFGTYTAYQPAFYYETAGYNRFQYIASGADFPFMTNSSTELTVRGAVGDSLGRGLQSWQIIYPEWSRLYFGEEGGTVCYATVPGAPRFYASGSALAADLQVAMNSPTCTSGSRQNTYAVSYGTGAGTLTFASAGPVRFQIRWADAPGNIAGALGREGASNTSLDTGSVTSGTPYTLLYRASTGNGPTPFKGGLATRWSFQENVPPGGTTVVSFYQVGSGRYWNGETILVTPTGEACAMTFATAATKTNPPSIVIQAADASCSPQTNAARFEFAGGRISGQADTGCNGFRSRSDLVPCDLRPPAPPQVEQIGPLLEAEIPVDATGDPRDWDGDGTRDYAEAMDGTWATSVIKIAPSIKYRSGTPIANSLIDIKGTANAMDTECVVSVDPATDAPTLGPCPERGFTKLWNQGQAGTTNMAGPPPWQLDPIKNHKDPKEKTIVLFVTDGNDTCEERTGSVEGFPSGERRAAYYAEELYRRIDPAEPASSVATYVLGYGFSSVGNLNFIAWGGTGLGQGLPGQPDVDWKNDSSSTLAAKRALCTTCVDAFAAPDAATLASQLQAIIDQGAAEGEFIAQQSITESVFEYVDRIPGNDASMPTARYNAIVPTLFTSSFSLPGFKGQVRAYQNDGAGNPIQVWSAGDKLLRLVRFGDSNATACSTGGMCSCDTTSVGGGIGECLMSDLHARASDSTIATSGAKIKRRIYTASRNGIYTFSPATLMAGTSAERVALWPPAAGVLPSANDYSNPGLFDAAMGLPPDTPGAYPPGSSCSSPTTFDKCWLDLLQRDFKACLGGNLPNPCTSSNVNTKMRAARREARDVILAFMAGAAAVSDGAGLKRASSGASSQRILFKAREWILADSELATVAVVTPPSLNVPEATPYVAEYKLYRDGTRDASGKNIDPAGDQIRQGFGLTQPDDDQTVAFGVPDTRANVKPVMTTLYAPANDMLHAFRGGPCDTPLLDSSGCADTGGEELWGFVPYDQLEAVRLRAANEPQGRENHVYMLARGVRFADVFVPGAMTNLTIGGVPVASMQGVWRRVLYFGRGIGGKYVTALDVTAPGPYTASALATVPPIPLWSRGNPDTQDGRVGGLRNGSNDDERAYARMGETWSIPTVAYVNPDKTNALYTTPRRRDGIDFAIFMGSGYGNPGEGTTHYTLDALSGDVIAAVDVEDVAAANGLTRSGLGYPNAIVANSVSFNRSSFASVSAKAFNVNPHPWSFVSTRVYVGDLHGRLWKFLTAFPNVAIPAADLGADQPVGTAVALMGQDIDPNVPNPDTTVPNIFVTSGNDRRAAGPFRNFSLLDAGPSDTDTATTGTEVHPDGVTTFLPVKAQFARTFDQGTPEADCGYPTEAVFRGTIQPTSAVECDGAVTNGRCEGSLLQRVFYGGTRLSVPNTKFAPPTPLACGIGEYPCRSQFDSILYALGVKSGQAAYDMNASGDDAYRIFRDSRIAAISFQADPDPGRGGARFRADEGLAKGAPKPPPIPGVPPTTTTATASVILKREPGQPAPVVQYGSTVCQ